MNDSRFRADRKIKLYENVRFNDKINELQSDVRHNRSQNDRKIEQINVKIIRSINDKSRNNIA